MSERMSWRERSTWLAAVVVFGDLVRLDFDPGHDRGAPVPCPPDAGDGDRTGPGRVVVALMVHAWPVLPLALLGGMMLALAVRSSAPARGKVRHA